MFLPVFVWLSVCLLATDQHQPTNQPTNQPTTQLHQKAINTKTDLLNGFTPEPASKLYIVIT